MCDNNVNIVNDIDDSILSVHIFLKTTLGSYLYYTFLTWLNFIYLSLLHVDWDTGRIYGT